MNKVGPERDKVIAELADDDLSHTFIPHPGQGLVAGMVCRYCDIPQTSVTMRDESTLECNKRIKPYSTDIACAMELWEEMKGAGYNLELSFHNKWGIICRFVTKHPDNTVCFTAGGETEADAISGAWLKWKETP